MTEGLIEPHGGHLVDRMATGQDALILAEQAKALPVVRLGMRPLSDLEMIAVGAFSPLSGFMTSADYEGVLHYMRLANSLPWSLPVTLSASKEDAKAWEGRQVTLAD